MNVVNFRKVAKVIVLGLNYGMSEYSIYEELAGVGLSFTLDEVRGFIGKYIQNFPGIPRWRNQIVSQSYAAGSIKTVLGRTSFLSPGYQGHIHV